MRTMQGGGMINCSAIRGASDMKNLCRKVHICDKTCVFCRNGYWREREGYSTIEKETKRTSEILC
jgi:hypothetical protein